ncbi:MAG: response regulator transcription factor [Terriglobia bacterium]
MKDKLASAIRALCDGHVWLPPDVLEHFARLALQAAEKKLPLTLRETDIVRLMGEGLSNKEIANRLGVTERTVKFHASNVFAKLGVHDRNSAIEIAHSLHPTDQALPASSVHQESGIHRTHTFP